MERNDSNPFLEELSIDEIQDQISDLTNMLNERYATLGNEGKNIEHEKSKLEAMQKIVSSFKDPIKLNIGGTIFMTSKSTILKHESVLSAMFSGRHMLEKGEDGAYFIDRDPKHFGRILNFLRDGEFQIPNDDLEKKELLREAEYYSLPELVKYISDNVSGSDLGQKFHVNMNDNSDTSHNDSVSEISDGVMTVDNSLVNFCLSSPDATINGAMATDNTGSWQSALTTSLSSGIYSCTFEWKYTTSMPPNIMFGVTGENFNEFKIGYRQEQSIMLHNNGEIFSAGYVVSHTDKYYPGMLTVELDCDKRTVTWLFDSKTFTHKMPRTMKAPYSFCVQLAYSTATIISILSREEMIEHKKLLLEAQQSPSQAIDMLRKVQFDNYRRSRDVEIDGLTVSYKATKKVGSWQSAFIGSFSTGVHSCTLNWTKNNNWSTMYIITGVTNANINHTFDTGSHKQKQSLMWCNSGQVFSTGEIFKEVPGYEQGLITVELNCNNKTVTLIHNDTRFPEDWSHSLQTPLSFVVDLYYSTATIVAFTSKSE